MGLVGEVQQVARGWRWTRRSLTPRSAEPWTPERERKEFPTAWARTTAGCVAREVVQRWVLRPLVWRETRPRVEGLDRLDGLRGPVVFVANHSSHLDAPLLLGSLPLRWRERTAVGAAADYFFDARWRAAATAIAFNAFPVDRRGGKKAASTVRQLLDDGWNLLLFPEGTRSPDGWMGTFRHGAARLCVERGVPIVPVALRGTHAAMPRGRSWAIPGRPPVAVRFGCPVYPGADERPRDLTARITQAVARAWHEEDTDWWTSLRAQADAATPPASGPKAADWRRRWESSRPLPGADPARVWRP
ncbi:MAG TPA: lysophospholipid acyltransferase family protein [Egibacteraceae bacterium]|nr:lysophospholipid acyltransferase family protein [Egibacteraceae bacterium]